MRRIVDSLTFRIIMLIVVGEALGVLIFSLVQGAAQPTTEPQALFIAGTLLFIALSMLTALLAVRVLLRTRTAELVAAQSALQQSEALYREIVNLAQDVIIHVRTDATLSYVSPSIASVLGYTPEEYCSDPTMVDRTLHPSGAAAFEAFWADYKRDGVFPERNLTLAWFARDGREVWLEHRVTNLRDPAGKVIGFQSVGRDITDRRRAEEALLASEERLRAIVNDIGVGVTLHDANGAVLMANAAACAILGYQTECDFVHDHNQRSDWAPIDENGHLIPPEQRPVRRARLTGQPVHSQVLGIQRRRTNEQIWLLMSAAPQFGPNGELRSIVCSFSDITAQRQLEERLRQAQKLEAVGRLAGGVAHDFNNLLTVITGACDLVLLDETLNDEARLDIEQIRQSSRRAADLTRQLLAFSRRQVLQLQEINLNDALKSAERLLRRLIGEDIQIVTRLDPELWPVRADPTQIDQVVLNLALNARDAMPEGGTLSLATANVLVTHADHLAERVATPGAYVRLTVRDTGSGITPELQPYIFEPFFTTKDSGRGTGLGLATVHGIVAQSGGVIWFSSATGEGTCFEIYLPRSTTAPLPALPEPPTPPAASSDVRETVLVVEDEQPVRLLVERVLRRQGYHVLVAPDGVAAREVLAAYHGPLHLLLTDMVMPGGVSGDRLAEEVRARYPMARVLLMSGYTQTLVHASGDADAGVAFLQKPFDPALLVRRVRELLDGIEVHHAPGRRAS